jgi:hypothetical protein
MINFVLSATSNYVHVQDHILGLIKSHLDTSEYSETVSVKRQDALNFTLFIGQPSDALMSHGVADKNYFWRKNDDGPGRRANQLTHAFVPGEWLRQRIIKSEALSLGADQVHTVGWPRLDDLLRKQAEHNAKPRDPSARPKVLWAPTHDFARRGEEMVTLSSYPGFSEYVPQLEKYADVMVSTHPRNRKDKRPTMDPLIEADIVISDFGTMVYEAWALGKPVIFPGWIIRDPILRYMGRGVAERHIFENRIGLHVDSFQELVDAVHGERAPQQDVTDFLGKYLEPRWQGASARRIADVLRTLAADRA